MRVFIAISTLLLPQALGSQIISGKQNSSDIVFAAERIEVNDATKSSILVGNVSLNQGSLSIKSNRATVRYRGDVTGSADVYLISADGNVHINKEGIDAVSNVAIYDTKRNLVTLLGNVRLTRDGNTVAGQRLALDLNSNRSVFDSSKTGGRVTGRFSVKPQ